MQTESDVGKSGTRRPAVDHTTPMHAPSLPISTEPTPLPKQHLTMRQCFLQVERETRNQVVDEPVLSACMQNTGEWGGRTPNFVVI
jgi:hypothetical protein